MLKYFLPVFKLQLRESYPDVRISFPRETDTDKETIHLVGKKEETSKVKKLFEEMINELVSPSWPNLSLNVAHWFFAGKGEEYMFFEKK